MNEYGIACLLDDDSVSELRSTIPFIDKLNYPHVTLFQFKCEDELILLEMSDFVKTISVSKEYQFKNYTSSSDYVFLNIVDDATLQAASDEISDKYTIISSRILPLDQIDKSLLSSSQLVLVEKYGIHWIRDRYIPHVTLAYNCQIKSDLKFAGPNTIKILEPKIYSIDYYGRIVDPDFLRKRGQVCRC